MLNLRLTHSKRTRTRTVGPALVFITLLVACSDDAATSLGSRNSAGAQTGSGVKGSGAAGSGANPASLPPEEVLFRAVEPDFQQKCGKTCHADGTYKPSPPTFLAGPDAYKSIKAQPGAIKSDYFQSALLQKGAHAGPAIESDPTFLAKVTDWLKMEAVVIQSQKKPSIDATAVVSGPNDIDLSKACVSGLTGVHLKFTASLVGGILALDNLKIVAPAGTDVHVYKPSFFKVLAKADAKGRTEIQDGADIFSNTDQTVPGGAETTLNPGSAFFTSENWSPFDFAGDKVRIEFEKLEPGKVSVVDAPKACKNVANFTNNVLPSLRGQAGGFNLNCANCHGTGLAGLALNNNDQMLVCNQVMQKLNEGNIGQSLIVTKVTAGPHNGGLLTNGAGWAGVFTNNRAVFF